ncbi:PspC domain-containing protein [Cryobacterium sp. PH31-L1]|uniref:PspC domain-containing protein n=1 Tax=Cryobacterium sp. PH31-L1 TaxID=3046199 RepID=UPI0024BBDEA5|nr:PspC domain-containing protein [Cryobacterium sp. PH31-L1]MDJ0376766.1 PspC domain-containing protein [Cryobacterium sp. PH31-L1]
MTETPGAQSRPDQITRFFDWIRGSGLNRDGDRWIAGVCGGIAARTGLDPLIVRGIAVVIAILGGPVVFAYAVGWALMPRGAGRIYTEDAIRGRFQPAMIAIGALLLFTVVPLFRGFWWNGPTGFWALPDWLSGIFSFGWGLAITAGIVWLIVYLVRRSRKASDSRPGFGPFVPPAGRAGPFGPGSVYDPRPASDPDTGAYPQTDTPAPSPESAPTSTSTESAGTTDTAGPILAFAATSTATAAPYVPTIPYAPDSARGIRSKQNRAWQDQNRARQQAHRARVRARRPGAGYSAIVLGLALATGAVAAWVTSSGVWSSDAVILGLAFALGVLALGIVIAGIRGRTDGAMGGFAFLAAATLVVLGVFPQGTQFSAVGNTVWLLSANSAVTNPDTSYAMIAGQSTLDLSDFDNPGLDEGAVIDVWLLAGVTDIQLPMDAPVRVESHALVGGVEYSDRAVATENGEHTGVFAVDARTFNASSRSDGPLVRIWTLVGVVTLDSSNN